MRKRLGSIAGSCAALAMLSVAQAAAPVPGGAPATPAIPAALSAALAPSATFAAPTALTTALAPSASPAPAAALAPSAASAASASSALAPSASLPGFTITAPEPRYVAPTLRDRLGRIWAPVMINGKGPYRLVLDTGASRSAIIASVARDLGLLPAGSTPVLLHGVTGSVTVATVEVDSLIVGDMQLKSKLLPIVPDTLGGADGVLGTEGLLDKRIFIDFMHDRITITRSHSARAAQGFQTVPVKLTADGLLTTTVWVGGIRVLAIIDTGGQVSLANLALRQALLRRKPKRQFSEDSITGATDDVQRGEGTLLPPIRLGELTIQGAYVTVGDLRIFDVWKLNGAPAMLIGIDTLGLLDTMIIDYRRQELQLRARPIYY